MKTIRGQELKPSDYASLQKQLDDLLWKLVYGPVVKKMRSLLPKGQSAPESLKELRNAPRVPLRDALRAGRIQMVAGKKPGQVVFKMVGSASTRAISDAFADFGARFNETLKAYTCDSGAVPEWVRAEAKSYADRSKVAHQEIKGILDDLKSRLDKGVDEEGIDAGDEVEAIHDGWKDAAKGLVVTPELTPQGAEVFEDQLAKNAKIEIKKLGAEAISRLREQVEENAMAGYRAEGMVGTIQQMLERTRDEYGHSKSRAELIALQETSNLMSGYRKARAKEAGCRRYMWRCTRDSKTRPMHKALNGKIFDYDHPPVVAVDSHGERRGNPGQDFRCFPGDSRVDFAYGIEKAFKRWYAGKLAIVKTRSGKTLRATPNHPVLTSMGWKPIGRINDRDCLMNVVDDQNTSFEDLFNTFVKMFGGYLIKVDRKQFHGDFTGGHVTVSSSRHLSFQTSLYPLSGIRAELPKVLKEVLLMSDEELPGFFKKRSSDKYLDRVIKTGREDFRGDVYNLSTRGHWYSVGGIVVHNFCRCLDLPVLEDN